MFFNRSIVVLPATRRADTATDTIARPDTTMLLITHRKKVASICDERLLL